jgi:[acyl-carrier-protein] S-malonyltransferase
MKFAFVFPGQGSQSVGMMDSFRDIGAVRETFREASDLLHVDFWRLVSDGSIEELGQTVNTQPVMLVSGIAVFRAWRFIGGAEPDFVAGHSLGEYTALVAAGALDLRQALPLVRLRAQAMQDAVPEGQGGIAAIVGLSDQLIREACAEAAQGEVLEPANFNCPGQVVIAGTRAAVQRAMEVAKVKGARRTVMLAMSAPSHCSLMAPAAHKLEEYLAPITLRTPEIPVLHNADVRSYATEGEIKDALVRQLCSPVRWVEIVQEFARSGVTHVVECGPGKVLAGLTKRITSGLESIAMGDWPSLERTKSALP